jgi:hypothetical protein
MQHSNAHHREQLRTQCGQHSLEGTVHKNCAYVMRGIRVFVNSTKESRRSIFPDLLCQQMTAARVLIEERTNIVNEARDDNKGAGLGLLQDCDEPVSLCQKGEGCKRSKRLTALVRDHGEINVFLWPSQAILNPPKALELHRKLALRNFIIWEHLRNNASVHFFHTHGRCFGPTFR